MKVNITDFCVKPNAEELQTEYIQKAIDYCFENGGGEVIVPAGNILSDVYVCAATSRCILWKMLF